MFAGRTHELQEMNRLYRRGGFQMVVLYGRRRVGKTTLALEFAKDKPCLAYTAKVQSDALNLADFSRELFRFFGLPVSPGPFTTWDEAFEYLATSAGDQQLVFVFDEFPYAAQKNASLASTLQIAVDRLLAQTNVFLILTGSNQGFMEEYVLGTAGLRDSKTGLGEKNPLFGRRTAQIHLGPLGYADAARMLPGLSSHELVEYYACFGGTPYYLSMVDTTESLGQNVTRLFFRKEGMLYEEPLMLLRQELREPSLYNSIMSAIAAGATTPTQIANRAGIERTAMGKYLGVLRSLGLIERAVPYGDNPETSKRVLYRVQDPCFAYWYRFVEPVAGMVEQNAGELVAMEALRSDKLSTYVGHWFEVIARDWLLEQAKRGRLPFSPLSFGSWWGTDCATRLQDDVDVVVGNPREKKLLLGECKWRNSLNETEMVKKQVARTEIFEDYTSFWYAFFTKNPVGSQTRLKYAGDEYLFVSTDDLYES